MEKFKILCTGNPDKFTIARAVKEVFPEADFASFTTGYNLALDQEHDQNFFKEKIQNYNVLINSSWIEGNQEKLLNFTYQQWKYRRAISHVINIGSLTENDVDPSPYSLTKLSLRKASLELNTPWFKTTHIVVDGIKHSNADNNTKGINPINIAKTIHWILQSNVDITLIQLQRES